MIDDILAAVPLGFLLSFMPGAVFFVLLETSVVKGFRAAMVFDFGAILADILFIAIAYFSSYRLIENIKDEPALFVFGGLIMLTYGLISFLKLTKASRNDIVDEDAKEIIKKNYLSLFLKGFILNFINVGVLGYWLLLIITMGPQLDMQPSRMFIFFSAVIGAYFVTDVFKVLLAKQLRSKLTSNNILKIKRTISVVIMIFGIALLIQGWVPANGKIVNTAIEQLEDNN